VRARAIVPLALAGAMLWGMLAAGATVVAVVLGSVPHVGGGIRSGVVSSSFPAPGDAPSATALADIPPAYLSLYRRAAARFGLDWTILAGIGRVECDHGQDPDPACTVEGRLNYAGAGGPAQFLVSTWQAYGITPTGTGAPDMWNPADAIFSMANYLHASGAPRDYPDAIYAYNHAWWYVQLVLSWARRYRARYTAPAAAPGPPSVPTSSGPAIPFTVP
jgi:hypothetical protein